MTMASNGRVRTAGNWNELWHLTQELGLPTIKINAEYDYGLSGLMKIQPRPRKVNMNTPVYQDEWNVKSGLPDLEK